MPLKRPFQVISIALISLLSACIADDLSKLQDPRWEPEVAIPLIDSRLGIERIISKFEDKGYLTSDPEGLVMVVYQKNLFTLKADSIFQLENIMFDLALLQQAGDVELPGTKFALKTMRLANGDLRLHIEDNVTEDVMVTLNMPKTTKGGQAFSETFTITYQGGSGIVFDTIMSLAGYKVDLSGDGTERNNLNINYQANRVGNGSSVDLKEFLVAFENMDYEYLDGYLGNLNLGPFNDSLKIGAFKNFKSGRIRLANPELNFFVDNGLGLPISITFNSFKAVGQGGSSELQGDIMNNGVNVSSPQNPGDTTSSNTSVNEGNSNLSQFLSITPGGLAFTIDVEANAGKDSSTTNFITKGSFLSAGINLKLPLRGSLDSVIIEDVYDFTAADLKKADKAEFRLFTRNSFPLGIYLQIYFLDDNDVVLDSLIQDNDVIFREALTDSKGFSVQAMEEYSQFTLGETRFGPIKEQTARLKIRAMLLTDGSYQKVIGIRNTDYFDIKLGARAVIKN